MPTKVEGRLVNQTELTKLFGFSAVTVRTWERRGCPVVTKGRKGSAAVYNTADVVKWREQQAAGAAAGDDNSVDEAEGKRRKVVAEARLAELELAREEGALVEIDAFAAEVGSVLARVRAGLLAIPGSLALLLANEPDPNVIRDRVFEEISGVLNELSTSNCGDADSGAYETAPGATEPDGAAA